MNAYGKPATLGLLALAGLTVAGCIVQVVLEEVLGRQVAVDPTLQTLSTTAIFAVFGQGFFTQHQATVGEMRAAFVAALNGAGPPSPTTSSSTSSPSSTLAAGATTSPSTPTTSSPGSSGTGTPGSAGVIPIQGGDRTP